MSDEPKVEQNHDRLRRLLDQQLATVQSREIARVTLEEILKRAEGSESDRSDDLTGDPESFLESIQRAASDARGPETVAEVLTRLTAYALSRSEGASLATGGAYAVFGAGPPPLAEPATRGRGFLRSAVLENMHELERAEAQLFGAVNGLPQPTWLRNSGQVIEFVATGGRMWIVGALLAALLRAPNSREAVFVACPTVGLVAAAVEWVTKPQMVRWRSFRHAVSMMILGVRPRRRSFPSGHAASSWAGALVFSRLWPDRSNAFVGLAALVSVSRVYLGAHGPGDVLVGSLIGLVLGDVLRRPFERLVRAIPIAIER